MKRFCEREFHIQESLVLNRYKLEGIEGYTFSEEIFDCKVGENEVSGAGGGDEHSDTEEKPIARIEKILEILKDRVTSVVVSVESIQIYTNLFYKSLESYDKDDNAQEE